MNYLTEYLKKILMFLQNHSYVYNIITILISLFAFYMFSTSGLMFILITIDSIFNAIDFLISNFDKTMTDSQIVISNEKLYNVGSIERYVYYIGASLTYFTTTLFLLNGPSILLKSLLVLTVTPIIFNKIIHTKLISIFDIISRTKIMLLKKLCAEQLTNLIIKLSKTYVDSELEIDKNEMIDSLIELNKLESDVYAFLKNILVVSLMIYLRNNARLYYRIAKYIYAYNSGEFITDMTIDDAKKLFVDLIKKKKYDQITKPMTIQSLIYLYYYKENSDFLETLVKKINYKIATMFMLWTISSLIPIMLSLPVILGISISLQLFRNNTTAIMTPISIISLGLTFVAYFYPSNIFAMCLMNQFGGYLTFNPITKGIYNMVYKNINNKGNIFINMMHTNRNIYIKYMLLMVTYLMLGTIPHVEYFVPIMINFISATSERNFRYLYPIMYISMINNQFNPIKLLFVAYVLSAIDNIMNYNKYTLVSDDKQCDIAPSQYVVIMPKNKPAKMIKPKHYIINSAIMVNESYIKKPERSNVIRERNGKNKDITGHIKHKLTSFVNKYLNSHIFSQKMKPNIESINPIASIAKSKSQLVPAKMPNFGSPDLATLSLKDLDKLDDFSLDT